MSTASFTERIALALVVVGLLFGVLSLVRDAVHALYAAILLPLAGF